MSSLELARGPLHGLGTAGALHRATLALVWIAVASGAIVFSEPAPVDLLMTGLVVLLPLVGLTAIGPVLPALATIFLVMGGMAFVATVDAVDVSRAAVHSTVSIYLYVSTLVLAAFVACRPQRHAELVLHAYVWAAVVTATAGLVGYFDLFPGAFDTFTKFGRASGTFKDPNVFGAFLVPAMLTVVHVALTAAPRRLGPWLLMAGLLGFAILLSFSRGAWINLGLALVVLGYLKLITAYDHRERLRLLLIAGAGALGIMLLLLGALQLEAIAKLFAERSQLTQSYDVGPLGRFGGQQKAIGFILDNPFGLGAQQFATQHHHEEPHNVYLNMLLNAGWPGGLAYWVLVLTTLVLGVRCALRPGPLRPLLIVVTAAFVGIAAEGFVIDSDHWRHFYVLVALIWGLAGATGVPGMEAVGLRNRSSRYR